MTTERVRARAQILNLNAGIEANRGSCLDRGWGLGTLGVWVLRMFMLYFDFYDLHPRTLRRAGLTCLLAGLLVLGCSPIPSDGTPSGAVCERIQCAQGQLCCELAAGEATCVDADSSSDHCGACGQSCGPNEVCSLGACQSMCEVGELACSQECVDPTADPLHCGGCNRVCAADTLCIAGDCLPCADGELLCDGRCSNPLIDRSRCGSTTCDDGVECDAGQVCDGTGNCAANCSEGFSLCGGDCFDLDTSAVHCGSCETMCDITERCDAGACDCRMGFDRCGDQCVNLALDASHCGGCAIACATDGPRPERCVDGVCSVCESGELDCDGLCVDPRASEWLCGAESCDDSDATCANGESCRAGTCVEDVPRTIAVGADFACALGPASDSRPVCWGANDHGQVGVRALADSTLPPTEVELDDVVALAAGDSHVCAMTAAGDVSCWGGNQRSQLTDAAGDVASSFEPIAVSLSSSATTISAAADYTCALLRGGELECWGATPDLAETGGVDTQPRAIAVPRASLLAAGGEHACVVTATGAAWCWGSHRFGQLGPALPEAFSASPVRVLDGVLQIAAGLHHSCVITAAEEVLCWGRDTEAAAGAAPSGVSCVNDGEICVYEPSRVMVSDAASIAAAGATSCIVDSLGEVRCWGANESGQAGIPSSEPVTSPVSMASVAGSLSHVSGGSASAAFCGVLDLSEIVCWGANQSLQLGDPALGLDWSSDVVSVAHTF